MINFSYLLFIISTKEQILSLRLVLNHFIPKSSTLKRFDDL